jgi:hypothetical protein
VFQEDSNLANVHANFYTNPTQAPIKNSAESEHYASQDKPPETTAGEKKSSDKEGKSLLVTWRCMFGRAVYNNLVFNHTDKLLHYQTLTYQWHDQTSQ